MAFDSNWSKPYVVTLYRVNGEYFRTLKAAAEKHLEEIHAVPVLCCDLMDAQFPHQKIRTMYFLPSEIVVNG